VNDSDEARPCASKRNRLRSMTSRSSPASDEGTIAAHGRTPRRSRRERRHMSKSAPGLSILFTKTSDATPCRSAWRKTVSDWHSTPSPPSSTKIAPSSTRRLRSTSMPKSTWPGVSTIWTRWPFHMTEVAAALIVILCLISSGSKSSVVSPWWTSPFLWMRPVQ